MGEHSKEFLHNQRIYLVYTISLVVPGRQLPVFPADQVTPGEIEKWSPEELALIIEEGRRQTDRRADDLRDIRGRAQWLFTVAVAALGALGSGLVSRDPGAGATALWLAGLVLLTYGIGGAASVMVSRADFSTIHTAVLSRVERPVDLSLAKSYAGMMATGENTVATRLTVFRQAAAFCLFGGYLGLLAALLS
jgi:hypothetical protein